MRTTISTLLAVTALALSVQAQITTEQKKDRLRVLVGGKLFTEYRGDTRVPCLYPLMSPSGTHLTRQFPFENGVKGEASDHKHHAGFWFTHGNVNGKDFWHKEDCKIVHKGFIQAPVVRKGSAGKAGGVTFAVNLAWEADGRSHLSEVRTYNMTIGDKTRTIDVTSVLSAPEADAVFGDTKEGSFSIRTTPSLRLTGEVAKGHILTSEGFTDKEAWGKRAKWVAYYGPDGKGTPAVIAILDHSKNLRHPTWWHARDYGLLTANPFGIRAFEGKKAKESGNYTLKKGQGLTQRYRLILHEGDLESAQIEKQWKEFVK